MPKSEFQNLSVVIPVYNSETAIAQLVDKLFDDLSSLFFSLEIVLVNDGSVDGSHQQCLKVYDKYPENVKYLKLSRNFGEHNAVMCGLSHVTGDFAAIIDDDFQNPPIEIEKLVKVLREGYDVVYSYYDIKRHSIFRNLGSKFNDYVASIMLKKPRGLYLSSFKVMSKFLVDSIKEYDGPYPYIDGLILRTTNSIGTCLCRHEDRAIGKSNYTLRKLVRLWLNMFTGYSVVPLRISTFLGFFVSGVGAMLAIFFFISKFTGGIFFSQEIPPGWASIIISITFFSGIILCLLGIIGEYLGRLYLTINKQPQFIVREKHVNSFESREK